MDFYATSDDVLRLSLLTMVYRAAPLRAGCPTSFSPECIDAARATLVRHQDCMSLIVDSGDVYLATYVHW